MEIKTCLLVEDDIEDQELFQAVLQEVASDIVCYTASNAEEALSMLIHEGFLPDYIFTDLQMPKINGLEFLKTLKRHKKLKNIPVVMYTSEYSDEHLMKGKELGVTAFYRKTCIEALRKIIISHLTSISHY